MIYFVRHGETDYNVKGIIQGQLDIPLNEVGIMQAQRIAQILKDEKIDLIYASPLSRTRVTAEIINEFHNVEVVFDDRLKEFFAGTRQGTGFSDKEKKEKAEFLISPEKFGAESNYEFYDRCVSVYKDILKLNKNVLIVSHGGVYRSIYRYLNNILDFSVKVPTPINCEVINIVS